MRGVATLLALLLALPLGSGIALPPATPPLPADLGDAALARLLLREMGHDVDAPPLVIPPGATVASLVDRLAARAGAPLAPHDAAAFHDLDPRVAAPTLAMLAAIDQAWTLRDQAVARLSPDERREFLALPMHDPRKAQLAAEVDMRPMYEAALLVLETLDGIVLPALDHAFAAGAWPPEPIADPAGILRLGSPGDDVETRDRMLQIDPAGDDQWRNNAGGTTILNDVDARTLDFPIAVSVDMAGRDTYQAKRPICQGAGVLGVGILYDAAGADVYHGLGYCQGASLRGVGYLRDRAGDDSFTAGGYAMGSSDSLGVFRDDAGDDYHRVGDESGGVGHQLRNPGLGLLWERGGADRYETALNHNEAYGWSRGEASGWLVEEGVETDEYQTATNQNFFRHGCNDCRWTASLNADMPYGRGLDNDGTLADLLADDTAMSHNVRT